MADPLVVKICGIKTPEILDVAIDAGADMVGFMHFARSPRHVDLDTLQELISVARGRIETCVVLVNPDNSTVMEIAALSPDWIQLHGPETPHRVETIRDAAGIAVMKAIPIGSASDVAHVADFAEVADRVLLDAKAPKGADRPGGLGEPFDWSLLSGLDPELPYLLSGGLTQLTVKGALATITPRPMGVDVSSGVESAPGVKDAGKIRAVISAVRAS
ncbi:phosphoribosylanthranilate isomerase [Devosia sp.]|uniref:phosphoribosylanthranilate isomerase n=1 Tax=Devosia sp. TaxID=1871048 RepID=UPI003A91DEC5